MGFLEGIFYSILIVVGCLSVSGSDSIIVVITVAVAVSGGASEGWDSIPATAPLSNRGAVNLPYLNKDAGGGATETPTHLEGEFSPKTLISY